MIIVRTPLRISFVGGGSDIRDFYEKKDGMVIATAIDKYVYAIVKERFDDMIYVNYSSKECVSRVEDIRHDLVREAMRMTGVDRGIEITTLADIPSSGSGLGSSSSITVALLHALYTYQNQLVTAEQLAEDACRIEIDILKKPIGRQDQYTAAFGGLSKLTFQAGDKTLRTPISLPGSSRRALSSVFLLYYTGITRSADHILKEQKSNLAGVNHFDTQARMADLVDPFVAAVKEGDIHRCGELLDENWRLKQEMASGISTDAIGEMYEKAKAAGAMAGKIAGAGGGGFLLLLVPREKQNAVFSVMKEHRELPFMFDEGGSKVIFDDRTYCSK